MSLFHTGSAKERAIFRRAHNRVTSGGDTRDKPLKLEMKFKEETTMVNGKDVKLELKLSNKDRTIKTMSIRVNARAMRYNGKTASNIQSTFQEKMIPPGQDVILPIRIPFSVYNKFMVTCDSMKVSAVAIDNQQEDDIYETETDLEDPSISIKVLGEAHVFRTLTLEVEFKNPLNEKLWNCSLTVIGCGLFKSDYVESNVKDLEPNGTVRLRVITMPYKAGIKTVVADFDCSAFRDVKGSCTFEIKP